MDANTYPRRSGNARAWLFLAAAAAAVALLLLLIAVACQTGGGTAAGNGDTTDGDTTNTGQIDDSSGEGGSGGVGQSGEGEDGEGGGGDGEGTDGGGSGDSEGSGDGEEPGDGEPADTGETLTGLEVVRDSYAVGANDYLRKGVRCPEGKVVLNGGFSTIGPDHLGDPFDVQESNPGTVGGGEISLWLISLRNHSAAPRNVDLYAVCADPPPGYEVTGHNASMDPAEVVNEIAECPTGKAVLGGGAQVVGAGSANFGTLISSSSPASVSRGTFGWRTVIGNLTPTARNIGFRVVCADQPAGFEIVSDDVPVPGNSFGTTAAACNAGTVIGGGLGPVDGNATQEIRQSYPDAGAGQWVGTFRNLPPAERLFRVWAVCAQAG